MPRMHEYAFPFCQGFFSNLNLQVIAHVHIDSKPFNKKHSCIPGNQKNILSWEILKVYFMSQMHEYAFPFCEGFFSNLNLQVIAHAHMDSKPFNKKHSCIRGN